MRHPIVAGPHFNYSKTTASPTYDYVPREVGSLKNKNKHQWTYMSLALGLTGLSSI